MKAHFAFLKTLIVHKWFVFLECCALGIPLAGVLHDISKFHPAEWFRYVRHFHNPDGSMRNVQNASGAYNPTALSEFRRAWLHHQRNQHHWQAWVVIGNGGELSTIAMTDRYRREMLADWRGAARTYNMTLAISARDWYKENKDDLILHPETRQWVEDELMDSAPLLAVCKLGQLIRRCWRKRRR